MDIRSTTWWFTYCIVLLPIIERCSRMAGYEMKNEM